MHADVGKELLAGILQAGTKDVDHIVDDEEAVVISLTVIDGDGGILCIKFNSGNNPNISYGFINT